MKKKYTLVNPVINIVEVNGYQGYSKNSLQSCCPIMAYRQDKNELWTSELHQNEM